MEEARASTSVLKKTEKKGKASGLCSGPAAPRIISKKIVEGE